MGVKESEKKRVRMRKIERRTKRKRKLKENPESDIEIICGKERNTEREKVRERVNEKQFHRIRILLHEWACETVSECV